MCSAHRPVRPSACRTETYAPAPLPGPHNPTSFSSAFPWQLKTDLVASRRPSALGPVRPGASSLPPLPLQGHAWDLTAVRGWAGGGDGPTRVE